MAGSYSHCRAKDGTFRFDLIENMRDAREACEMMFFMINFMGSDLPGAKRPSAEIQEAEDAYFKSINPSYKAGDAEALRARLEDDDEDDSVLQKRPRWAATTNLRFVKRLTPVPGSPELVERHTILQQRFLHTDGTSRWEDVPLVDE